MKECSGQVVVFSKCYLPLRPPESGPFRDTGDQGRKSKAWEVTIRSHHSEYDRSAAGVSHRGHPRGGPVSISIFVNTSLPRRASEKP